MTFCLVQVYFGISVCINFSSLFLSLPSFSVSHTGVHVCLCVCVCVTFNCTSQQEFHFEVGRTRCCHVHEHVTNPTMVACAFVCCQKQIYKCVWIASDHEKCTFVLAVSWGWGKKVSQSIVTISFESWSKILVYANACWNTYKLLPFKDTLWNFFLMWRPLQVRIECSCW